MLARWDTLLVAIALAGGSVLIENSHRVDTGAPDDEVAATASDTCSSVSATAFYGDGATASRADEPSQTVQDPDTWAVPSSCTDR
jgi:hypothetical protein